MNIGDRHLNQQPAGSNETADIHFKIEGPIIEQFQEVFDERRLPTRLRDALSWLFSPYL